MIFKFLNGYIYTEYTIEYIKVRSKKYKHDRNDFYRCKLLEYDYPGARGICVYINETFDDIVIRDDLRGKKPKTLEVLRQHIESNKTEFINNIRSLNVINKFNL